MSLLDPKRIRPDVAAFLMDVSRRQQKAGLRYLLLHPNPKIPFLKMQRRLEEDQERLLRSGSIDLKTAQLYFPAREARIYHARVSRAVLASVMAKTLKGYVRSRGVTVRKEDAGGVPAEWLVGDKDRGRGVILHIHGGGFNLCSAVTHRGLTARLCSQAHTRILSINYRLAPEHRHPAALDDCLRSYLWLIEQGYAPQRIIMLGDSAGGNLTLSLVHHLKQEGMALPGGLICLSPFTDWTFQGQSWFENAPSDPIVSDLPTAYYGKCYLDLPSTDLRDPLVSPLHGEFSGFPPLLLQVSKSEMCYDDSRRVGVKAQAAGVRVELQEWEQMIHVFPMFGLTAGWQEVEEAFAGMSDFIGEILDL